MHVAEISIVLQQYDTNTQLKCVSLQSSIFANTFKMPLTCSLTYVYFVSLAVSPYS